MGKQCSLQDCHVILQTLEGVRSKDGLDSKMVNELSACCANMRAAIQAAEKDAHGHEGLLHKAWTEAKEILEKYAKYV